MSKYQVTVIEINDIVPAAPNPLPAGYAHGIADGRQTVFQQTFVEQDFDLKKFVRTINVAPRRRRNRTSTET